jgi:hypothetical protein
VSVRAANFRLPTALACVIVALFSISAYGQSPAGSATSGEGAVAGKPKPGDLEKEVEAVKAENAAVREQLRRMEEQQKALLDTVNRLQQQLNGTATAQTQPAGTPNGPQTTNGASPPAASAVVQAPQPAATAGGASAPPVTATGAPGLGGRYQDGIIIAKSADDADVPYLLRFNNITQVRYLNTTNSVPTFTDHLGVVRDVSRRNDITVNRTMFIFGGYVFDKRLRYSTMVWTSAGAASIVVTGNVGWQFNKGLTLTAGYGGVPGSRTLVDTFPFFSSSDRTMADNFFRPSFTQGVWATGEPAPGLFYKLFLGNGLNTLNISAAKIDTSLLVSGSVWWEPFGNYGGSGISRNMYDDYFASKTTRVRIGTAYTRSREDRYSNLDQTMPDNTALYNSDGVLTFGTGAFAPGVTVDKALYRMWAIDGGVKWNGWAVNGQYYMRWLDEFEADGPIPVTSTYDQGFELIASDFIIPRKLVAYVRGSSIFGYFGDSWEAAGGVKWYFLPTERMWLAAELMRTNKVPYSGTFTPYTAGMTGWVPMVQTILAF